MDRVRLAFHGGAHDGETISDSDPPPGGVHAFPDGSIYRQTAITVSAEVLGPQPQFGHPDTVHLSHKATAQPPRDPSADNPPE